MQPGIEIWDLDDWEAVQPCAVLGGDVQQSGEAALTSVVKERKRKEKKVPPVYGIGGAKSDEAR